MKFKSETRPPPPNLPILPKPPPPRYHYASATLPLRSQQPSLRPPLARCSPIPLLRGPKAGMRTAQR